jgi:2-dehydro-3-deoxyphosphogluconate aldolase/(4S)-4-hydroxy-2-oxoglutarate aldolase
MSLDRLKSERVVAVVRAPSADVLLPLSEALVEGGIRALEVTMSTPDAIEGIRRLSFHWGEEAWIGVGTVLDVETAKAAAEAGAAYCVSPVLIPEVIEAAKSSGMLAMPGAMTPTEAFQAYQLGADVVKIFPATSFGPGYFRDLLAPMPFLRLMPTGGVEAENVGDWLKAGAVAVGAGSSLVPKQALADGDWMEITARARRFRLAAEGS